MLNPYVPGNAGSTSATAKKGKLPADPLNDPMNPPRFAGPSTSEVMTTGGPSVGGEQGNNSAPRPIINQPASARTQPIGGFTGAASGGTNLTNIPRYQFAEDRLTDMISDNSRYMQRARREGLNAAAARGGINSSIAGGYALGAAIDRAAPIATADAQFTQEDYLTGRRALLDDIRSGNDSGRRMAEDTNRGTIQDSLAGNENVREMGRMNLNADLTNQRDRSLSTLRRTEMQFETNLRDQLGNNETQRAAWLNQQTSLSNAYAQAFSDGYRSNLSFIDMIGQAFVNDPEVYSPEVVSGMTNFFQSLSSGTTNAALSQILRSLMATGGAATQPVQPTQPPVGG